MKVFSSDDYIEAGMSMTVFRHATTQSESEHTHDFIEIVYALSGEAEQEVGEDRFRMRRGDLIFLNYGTRHAFVPHGSFSYINICFAPEKIAGSSLTRESAFAMLSLSAFNEIRQDGDHGMVSFSGNGMAEIEQLLLRMLDEYERRRPAYRTVLDSCLNILFACILRKTVPEASLRDAMWAELFSYIDENLGERLTLSALAAKCFYNPSYFSRMFKEKFGMPLSEYLLRRRVEYAGRLLFFGDTPIETIAEAAGFCTKSAFYRAFGRVMGMTPGAYRVKTRGKGQPVKKQDIQVKSGD